MGSLNFKESSVHLLAHLLIVHSRTIVLEDAEIYKNGKNLHKAYSVS